ncbi:hypothetical protein SAMN04487972_1564 [Paracoccus halophilus]|uniref:Uncharacterized protein n=1 Tax=Paracoccus halophilus TaxID=376733 RepID=A0A099ETC0_9RHOB|nr:hypothetical protein [Paracoccus halophilus]KGJ01670.1 hypothetical protein IT41_19550 [Paracoccus halophilus]SFA62674.1 hypothetical protein SAMN04487972_1564 [Paracoccus halophilus]
MSETPENHTIRLLQELRKEMREGFDNVNVRMDGITHIMTLLAGHYHNVEERLSALEDRQKP